jgi:hypothetical protein
MAIAPAAACRRACPTRRLRPTRLLLGQPASSASPRSRSRRLAKPARAPASALPCPASRAVRVWRPGAARQQRPGPCRAPASRGRNPNPSAGRPSAWPSRGRAAPGSSPPSGPCWAPAPSPAARPSPRAAPRFRARRLGRSSRKCRGRASPLRSARIRCSSCSRFIASPLPGLEESPALLVRQNAAEGRALPQGPGLFVIGRCDGQRGRHATVDSARPCLEVGAGACVQLQGLPAVERGASR